ncbi:MAG TPA: ACT domain-containing protein [candidate division Zixibacteria bacterium]|nr:ACT domain-containing protein [candidate division Zixibacteria bacterium]
MNAFIIELANKPGMLADVAEAIAEKGINITAVAGATSGQSGSVAILTNDEAGTRSVLESRGITFRAIPLVSATMPHRPGSLADASRRLANAGVNIEALFVTGSSGDNATVAFAVEDADAARQALGELAGTTVG